jgi:hypothetical protein
VAGTTLQKECYDNCMKTAGEATALSAGSVVSAFKRSNVLPIQCSINRFDLVSSPTIYSRHLLSYSRLLPSHFLSYSRLLPSTLVTSCLTLVSYHLLSSPPVLLSSPTIYSRHLLPYSRLLPSTLVSYHLLSSHLLLSSPPTLHNPNKLTNNVYVHIRWVISVGSCQPVRGVRAWGRAPPCTCTGTGRS